MYRYNKYHAKRTEYNGTVFASKKEARYAQELDWLIRSKEVVRYEMQVPFPCTVNGKVIGKYVLDFRVHYPDGHIEHVDVKGMKTPLYRWKKKHVEAEHGISIREV